MKNSMDTGISLQEQLLKECIAMAKYAFRTGLQVPPELSNSLNALSDESSFSQKEGSTEIDTSTSPTTNVNPSNFSLSVKQLSLIHNQLSQLILPAKPQTILLFDEEAKSNSKLKFLGPIPLVRYLILIAIFFLASIMIISIHPEISHENIIRDWFDMQGWVLVVNLSFLLSAAGLGAAFAALFQLNKYVVNGTYDPKYVPSYWIRFALGLIAGILLAELIDTETSSFHSIGKPMLAMLGGFSASLVYRILKRLVTAVEALVRGDANQLIETQERAAKNRAVQEITQNRLKLATDLVKLKQQIGKDLSPEEMNEMINGMLNKVLPYTTEEEVTETKSPA